MSDLDVLDAAAPGAIPRLGIGEGIVDCDIHPTLKSLADLEPYLERRWVDYLNTFGNRRRDPFLRQPRYPKNNPATARRDSWPPTGGPPGSDLPHLRTQHLDSHDIAVGVLQPLSPHGMDSRHQELGTALCRAVNSWQSDYWLDNEPRLRGSITVPGEIADEAIAEIEHWADDRRFCQVSICARGLEPLGRKRYWPVYDAAIAAGRPLGLHISGMNGLPPSTGIGWPSFEAERHHETAIAHQAALSSLVMEGALARFPDLRVVLVEGGFAWLPSFCWRLDQHWARMRAEVPDVTRPPSEYIREQVWLTTQPVDEPERPDDILDIFEWIGWDRVLFATDYPHWDFDDPKRAIKAQLTDANRRKLFRDNAIELFNLGG